MKYLFLYTIAILFCVHSNGQTKCTLALDTLCDKHSGNYFVLNDERNKIIAFNASDIKIWESGIREDGVKKTVLSNNEKPTFLTITKFNMVNKKELVKLNIVYSDNTQLTLESKTGKTVLTWRD